MCHLLAAPHETRYADDGEHHSKCLPNHWRQLAAKGEGPIGLALPVIDLNIAVRRLGGVGVEVATIAPHVVIHPSDTAGVLVQLTPRVNH